VTNNMISSVNETITECLLGLIAKGLNLEGDERYNILCRVKVEDIDDFLQKVLKPLEKLYPSQVNDFEKLKELINQGSMLLRSMESYAKCILGSILSPSIVTTEKCVNGLFNKILNYNREVQEFISKVRSGKPKSFTGALYALMNLIDIEDLRIELRDPEISRIWILLDERNISIYRQLYVNGKHENFKETINIINKLGERLSNARILLQLEDSIVKERRDEFINIIMNLIRDIDNKVDLHVQGHIADYIFEHLATARNEFKTTKDLERYINIVLSNRAYLEYELYHYLVSHGIPTLPRLYYNTMSYKEKISGEIDILAVIDDKIHIFEASTRREFPGEKLDHLKRFTDIVGQRAYVMVITYSDVCVELKQKHMLDEYGLSGIECINFENMYEQLDHLLIFSNYQIY